jgi:hypothetical protein
MEVLKLVLPHDHPPHFFFFQIVHHLTLHTNVRLIVFLVSTLEKQEGAHNPPPPPPPPNTPHILLAFGHYKNSDMGTLGLGGIMKQKNYLSN